MKKIIPFLICLVIFAFTSNGQPKYLTDAIQVSGKGQEFIQVQQNSKGEFIALITITPATNDTIDLDLGPGIFNFSVKNLESLYLNFLCKYDKDFNLIWAKPITGIKQSGSYFGSFVDAFIYPQILEVDKFDNIIIAGLFIGIMDFDPGPGQYFVSDEGYFRTFISKMDSNGNLLWVNNYNTDIDDDFFKSIEFDSSNNIIVLASLTGNIDFDRSSNTYFLPSTGPKDIYTFKLTPNGKLIWANKIGTSYSDLAAGMVTDPLGNTYFCGTTVVDIDADPGTDTFIINHIGQGDFNHIIVALDKDGKFKWAKNFENLNPTLVKATDNGDLYITGSVKANFNYNINSGTTTLDPANGPAFLAKYDSLGNLYWINQNYPGPELKIVADNEYYLYSKRNTAFLTKTDSLFNVDWSQQFYTSDSIYTSQLILNNNEVLFYGSFYGKIHLEPFHQHDPLVPQSYDIFLFRFSSSQPLNVWPSLISENIKIYPNPTEGLIHINGIKAAYTITIYDITGKAISKKVIKPSGKTELEIAGIPGIYFIEVLTEQGERQVFKVVKL